MYTPTAKGYFSGAGLMEIGLMQAGINIIQSLDLDSTATDCMKLNSHYFMTKLPNYYVNVFCPIKASYWLPQRRDRLILIGTKRPFFITHPNEINNRPRLKDIIEINPDVHMPEYVMSRIKGKYRDKPIIVDPEIPGAIAPTCVAHYSKDLGTRLVKDKHSKFGLRPFSIKEYARLQGVPDDYLFVNKMSSYRLIGNGVAVPMAKWIGKQAMKYFN